MDPEIDDEEEPETGESMIPEDVEAMEDYPLVDPSL